MTTIRWNIQRDGRAWTHEEFHSRADVRPEKLEISEGKLLFEPQERLDLLGLLLEGVGADQAVRLGDPAVWIAAVQRLEGPTNRRPFFSDPFNRWMLALWCLNLAVVVMIWLTPHPVPGSPIAVSVIVSAVVAFGTSLGAHAFLK